jgi:hypothetical protein
MRSAQWRDLLFLKPPTMLNQSDHKLVILNVTEGGVKDLLHLPFRTGAKRRPTSSGAVNF